MNPPPTILVVDDDPRCRDLLLNVLEPEGYRVLTAENGPEALASANLHRPDVVLLDVMMPGMDGFEVCRTLRSDRALAHLPVIFTTALDDRKSRLRGIEAGADDFVSKPVDIQELRTRLRSVTRLNRFRLQAEERMRFEQVVSFSPDGIAIADAEGRILMANPAFRALFAGTEPPTNVLERVHDDDLSSVVQLLEQAVTTPDRLPPARVVRLQAPAERYVEMNVAALPWDGGRAWQFCVRDITEKRQLEQQVLRTQRLDLLGQLAGGIIHDVNNLLSGIAAQAALMGMGEVDPESAKRLTAIEMASFQGGGLLRQLLLFARGRDGEICEIDPMAQLCEFHNMVQQALGERIKVEVDVPNPVNPFAADANQVHQVLMNLCVNARDAMPHGGTITLRLDQVVLTDEAGSRLAPAVPAGTYVVYHVSDTGTGIPPKVRERMFEPFFTTKPVGKGTGLGLATVLRVMQRHHGHVCVDSIEGKGTTFSCYFPAFAVEKASSPEVANGAVTAS